jgi:hypothetical protein
MKNEKSKFDLLRVEISYKSERYEGLFRPTNPR